MTKTKTRYKDITGQRFGRLVAIQPLKRSTDHEKVWLCRCDCGQSHITRGTRLRSGFTQSCGCLKFTVCLRHGHRSHRMHHPLYATWCNMHQRCNNPDSPSFKWYGAHGIEVCERWGDFANFLADVGERPSGLSLDRVNNDGHYEPSNIRWATPKQQANNKRPRRSRA
jgi:hypothetical protein